MAADLFVVPQCQVLAAWPEIAPLIARIEQIDPEEVFQDLIASKAQAWGLRGKGFFITRIDIRRGKPLGVVWACAGDGMLEAGLIDTYREHVEPWFWSQGCDRIEIHARKGWKKFLTDYDETSVILVKKHV